MGGHWNKRTLFCAICKSGFSEFKLLFLSYMYMDLLIGMRISDLNHSDRFTWLLPPHPASTPGKTHPGV